MKRADAIFLGVVERIEAIGAAEVTRSEDVIEKYGMTTVFGRDRDRVATFRVLKVWKGPRQPSAAITTGAGGGDCGYDFIVGEVYLVYAQGGGTGICSGTKRAWKVNDIQEDLRVLGPEMTVHE